MQKPLLRSKLEMIEDVTLTTHRFSNSKISEVDDFPRGKAVVLGGVVWFYK